MGTRGLAIVCCIATGLGLTARADNLTYTVNNGNKVDAETYRGYQLYRNWCARCHGTYGQGLAGPDLTQSLKTLSFASFSKTLAEGKQGRIGSMPAWQSNAAVMAGRQDIYRYLKARADGALGAIKPEKY